jgi:hypothetical protein
MYRTRRQTRYARLIDAGYLPFEAVALSKITLTDMPPYMSAMIRERARSKAKAIENHKSKEWFENEIKKLYRDKHWVHKTKSGNIHSISAYAMLRDKEDAYRDKYPNYVSPWEKRLKDFNTGITKAQKMTKRKYSAYLDTLKRELELAKRYNKTQQIGIIQGQIDSIESWLK